MGFWDFLPGVGPSAPQPSATEAAWRTALGPAAPPQTLPGAVTGATAGAFQPFVPQVQLPTITVPAQPAAAAGAAAGATAGAAQQPQQVVFGTPFDVAPAPAPAPAVAPGQPMTPYPAGPPTLDPNVLQAQPPTAIRQAVPPEQQQQQQPVMFGEPFNVPEAGSVVLPPQIAKWLTEQGYDVPGVAKPGKNDLVDYDPSIVAKRGVQELTPYSYAYADRDFDQLRQLQGAQALDKTQLPQLTSDIKEAVPLTRKAYLDLNESQRRAVDFNTLLVKAREKDLQAGVAVDPNDTQYAERVKKMFGEGGGSAIKGDATLKLLEDVKFDAVGQDLDEFLSMKGAVSFDKLKDINLEIPDWAVKSLTLNGEPGSQNWIKERSQDQQTNRQNALLLNTAVAIKNARVQSPYSSPVLQGLYAGDETPLGWGDPSTRKNPKAGETESTYQKVYAWLADPKNKDMAAFQQQVDLLGWSQPERDKLYQYVDNYTKWEDRGTAPMTGRRTPQEIRQLLGLEKNNGA